MDGGHDESVWSPRVRRRSYAPSYGTTSRASAASDTVRRQTRPPGPYVRHDETDVRSGFPRGGLSPVISPSTSATSRRPGPACERAHSFSRTRRTGRRRPAHNVSCLARRRRHVSGVETPAFTARRLRPKRNARPTEAKRFTACRRDVLADETRRGNTSRAYENLFPFTSFFVVSCGPVNRPTRRLRNVIFYGSRSS